MGNVFCLTLAECSTMVALNQSTFPNEHLIKVYLPDRQIDPVFLG
jgi:hypothetical protein